MGRYKDNYVDVHDELIAEMLDDNPAMTEEDAYAKTTDDVHGRMTQNWAEYADYTNDREGDGQCSPTHS